MPFTAIEVPGDGNCLFHSIIKICELVEFDYRKFPGLLLPRARAVRYLRGLAAAYGKKLPPDLLGDPEGLAATIQELPNMGAWSKSYYAFTLCLRVLGLTNVGIVANGTVYQPSSIGVYLACSGGHFWVELDSSKHRPPSVENNRIVVLRELGNPSEKMTSYLRRFECSV